MIKFLRAHLKMLAPTCLSEDRGLFTQGCSQTLNTGSRQTQARQKPLEGCGGIYPHPQNMKIISTTATWRTDKRGAPLW